MGKSIKEYQMEFTLDSGAKLQLLLFNNSEHTWRFGYMYRNPVERMSTSEPCLINNLSCYVNYLDGIAQKCSLSMDIKRPDKRGKEFWYGIDVSPGSQICLEMEYERQDNLFVANTGNLRCNGSNLDLLPKTPGLVKPIEFPFPVTDRIEKNLGKFRVPFLRNDGQIDNFEFPESYRRVI